MLASWKLARRMRAIDVQSLIALKGQHMIAQGCEAYVSASMGFGWNFMMCTALSSSLQ